MDELILYVYTMSMFMLWEVMLTGKPAEWKQCD